MHCKNREKGSTFALEVIWDCEYATVVTEFESAVASGGAGLFTVR